MPMYKMDEDTQIDEFGVDHSNFSLRDEIEYNYHRAKEKEMQNNSTINQNNPWYSKTYHKVLLEADKLRKEPVYDKYKHAVVSCTGAQDGLYGSGVTFGMGVFKEDKDIYRKFKWQWNGQQDYGGYPAIYFDSMKDMKANLTGIGVGYANPTGDCYEMMKDYYNPTQNY